MVDAEKFATDHYNISESEFKVKIKEKYGSILTIEAKSAIDHWFQIQHDLEEFFNENK